MSDEATQVHNPYIGREDPLMPPASQHFSPDALEVLKAQAAWGRAEASHDIEGMMAVIHPDCRITGAINGVVSTIDRATFIDSALVLYPLNAPHEFIDQEIIIEGDTAGSMLTEIIYKEVDGVKTKDAYRITAAFVRREGVWTCLFEEIASIDAAPLVGSLNLC